MQRSLRPKPGSGWEIRWSLFASLLFVVRCAPTAPVAPNAAVLDLHADTAFLPKERRAIQLAAIDAALQTRGAVRIALQFDVDAALPGALTEKKKLLLRVDSLTPFISTLTYRHGAVLGATVGKERIYVVADRLHDERVLEHVVLHEMLHLFGVGHVSDPHAVMSVVTYASSVTEFTSADEREFKRAFCSP